MSDERKKFDFKIDCRIFTNSFQNEVYYKVDLELSVIITD